MMWRKLIIFKGYIFALGANLLALALTHFLSPILVPTPFPIFVTATALLAWFFGIGAGLFSTVLATLITNFFFQPPLFLLTLGKEDVPRVGLFLLVTVIGVSLMRAQKQAAESQARLGAIVAFSEDAIIGLSQTGLISSWNAGATRIYGYAAQEMIGHPILRIVDAAGAAETLVSLERALAGEPTQQHESLHLKNDGHPISTSITMSPIRNKEGKISGASMIARDISDRKLAQAKLQEYADQLQLLSRRLVEVQEEERRTIARELHDEIGQTLTGLILIITVIPQLQSAAASEKLLQAQELVNDLFERVSRLTLDLRPPMLDDLGLLPTLLWHIKRYTAMTGIQVEFHHSKLDQRRFDPAIETAAYRIIQEALTNVARHASATKVTVSATSSGQGLSIQLQDNGHGFDFVSTLSSGKASGLVGIRERAELLGGSFSIQSTPEDGTRLNIELPIPVEKGSAL